MFSYNQSHSHTVLVGEFGGLLAVILTEAERFLQFGLLVEDPWATLFHGLVGKGEIDLGDLSDAVLSVAEDGLCEFVGLDFAVPATGVGEFVDG